MGIWSWNDIPIYNMGITFPYVILESHSHISYGNIISICIMEMSFPYSLWEYYSHNTYGNVQILLFFLLFCHATSPLQKCAKLMALSEVEPPQVPLRSACGSTRLQRHMPSLSASLAPSLLEHHARPVRGVVSRAYFEP